MFYNYQNNKQKKLYVESLQLIGSLSNLFSESTVPYLYYRVAEKIFCTSFLTHDLSRGDVALDAYLDTTGIGLKTFLAKNHKSFQKVAEFNKDRDLYTNKSEIDTIKMIASLRNKRISFTENLYGIEHSLYHCVIRDEHAFKIYEEEMHKIDIHNINEVKKKNNTIKFNDGLHEYSFNISKSTLTKRFVTDSFFDEFQVDILSNPLDKLNECLHDYSLLDIQNKISETIYLPLYGHKKIVYPKSGLNQWNANGRTRDINEVYIPIPIAVHKKSPNFFPNRDTPFDLKLPNGNVLQVKVCQSDSKALMSYSNKALGQWILRDVLNLEYEELVTYAKLRELGIDSVRIDKINNLNYEINFSALDSYETFIEEN